MFFKIEHHLLIQLICNHAGLKKKKNKKTTVSALFEQIFMGCNFCFFCMVIMNVLVL